MSEKRILLASLLKPVSDTRMYEKLGLSLCKLTHTQVHICGYVAQLPANTPQNLTFHPLFSFKRISFSRVKAQFSFYKLLKKIKPHTVVITTHELWLPAYIYSQRHKVKLIYDVQENYALNLRSQQNYPYLVKHTLAWVVKTAERLVAPKISHFLLAEKSYASELSFIGNRYTVLENKFKAPADYTTPLSPIKLNQAPLRLLYSGTIALEYGIMEAIALADSLYQLDKTTTLTIIGYCANSKTLQKVTDQIRSKEYIKLIGGEKLVPHQQILEEIKKCNVGLLPYRPNKSTSQCVPTKFFEYMAYALVIAMQQNPLWQELLSQHKSGLSVNFSQVDAGKLLNCLRHSTFYTCDIPKNIFWSTEEKNLLNIFLD